MGRQILHGIDRVDPVLFFELAEEESRTRGHKYKIKKQRCNTNLRLKGFSCRVVDTWNSLPESDVSAQNVNMFKNRLNSFWKDHPNKFFTILLLSDDRYPSSGTLDLG